MVEDMGGSNVERSESNNFFAPGQPGASMQNQPSREFGMLGSHDNDIALDLAGSDGSRYYTIQRVNGNGGNGKGDGTAGPHKHSLQESDRVKKNSIARHFLKLEKVKKKTQVRRFLRAASVFGMCERGFQTARQTTYAGMHVILVIARISIYFPMFTLELPTDLIKLDALDRTHLLSVIILLICYVSCLWRFL